MELGNMYFGNSRGMYEVDRSFQYFFVACMEDLGFDSYGHYVEEKFDNNIKYEPKEIYEDEVLMVNPYYWGEDEELMNMHNFIYKPMNLEIDWYKYPLRDSYSNQFLVKEQLIQMFIELYQHFEANLKNLEKNIILYLQNSCC